MQQVLASFHRFRASDEKILKPIWRYGERVRRLLLWLLNLPAIGIKAMVSCPRFA